MHTPTEKDFLPADLVRPSISSSSRQAPSYWEDSWRRLMSNGRAALSLVLILFLLGFAILGPLLWPTDPTRQVLSEISQGPSFGGTALLVANHEPWIPPSSGTPGGALGKPLSIKLLATPTTEFVRFTWTPVPGARRYIIYRHELMPSGINDLGLPMADTSAQISGYEDRMGLESGRYYYSVVAEFDSLAEARYSTIAVDVIRALTIDDARAQNLLGDDVIPAAGTLLTLPAHPFGTDYLGRDILARAMSGARTSLFIGIAAPLAFVSLGLLYGTFSGFVGGQTDNLMMRFADFVVALPFLLFMILFKIAFGIGPGESGIMPMLIALILLSWPATARLVRGQVLLLRGDAYVQAAQLMGARTGYLVWRHLIPNIIGVTLVTLTFAIPSAIFIEAFLSFIGMGVAPPTPSWGSMCNDGIRGMLSHPHELIVPALLISVTVLAFNLLGDGLRDALDARMKSA